MLTEQTIQVSKTPQYLLTKLSKRDVQSTFQASIEGTLSIDKTSHSTKKQHVLP